MDSYCKYCNKTLSDFERHHNSIHNPDKQLCRPCFIYRQPESQLQPPPMTAEQKAAESERIHNIILRLKAAGEAQSQ